MNFADSDATARLVSGGCERRATAISRTRMPVAAIPERAPSTTAWIEVAQVQFAEQVESGSPADLRVPGAIRGDILDQLVRDTRDRRRVLHDRDWEIERLEELGLVCGLRRTPSRAVIASRSMPSSRPRSRASSSAVVGRSEPSRWRCSSALGMRRKRSRTPRSRTLRSSPTVTRSYGSGPHNCEPRLGPK